MRGSDIVSGREITSGLGFMWAVWSLFMLTIGAGIVGLVWWFLC